MKWKHRKTKKTEMEKWDKMFYHLKQSKILFIFTLDAAAFDASEKSFEMT